MGTEATSQRVLKLKEQLLDAITDEMLDTLQVRCHVYMSDDQRQRMWQRIRDSLSGSMLI